MILAGSFRSIVVKLAYQSGFQAPLTVTLLSFLGKSLSVLVYWVPKWFAREYYNVLPNTAALRGENDANASSLTDDESDESCSSLELGTPQISSVKGSKAKNSCPKEATKQQEREPTIQQQFQWSSIVDFYTNALHRSFSSDEIPNGSNHGLSSESEKRIRWVHHVPFYVRPAIPAILNLLASALRWTSLVYIDASVVEMMVSGVELTLSVVAARIFRKRIVAPRRWVGVTAVAAGVIIIERANSGKSSGDKEEGDMHSTHDVMIGVILILIQSILSVLQDLAEEIFMQVSGSSVPATMMLGIEGLYGFVVGAIIYFTANETLHGIEDANATMTMLRDNAMLRWWLAGLPLIFLITGIFNIKATEVTSAMTRNVWKTLRTGMVWMIALSVYYFGNNPALGEAWHVPQSFVLLFGYMVMSGGILAYYSHAEVATSE